MKITYLQIFCIIVYYLKSHYSLPLKRETCEFGCKNCYYNNQDPTCTQCEEGFILNSLNGFCQYQQCDQDLVLSKSNNEKKCTAICESPQIADYDIKQCIDSEECHKFFVSKTYPSQKIQIRSINIFSDQYLLISYDSYFNIVDRITGEIIKSIQYLVGTIKLQILFDIPLMILTNKIIIQKDFDERQREVILQISSSIFTPNSEILNIDDKIVFVTSFSQDLKSMFITPIFDIQSETLKKITQDINQLVVDISNVNAKFLRDFYLVETKNLSIRVQKLQIISNQQFSLQFEQLLQNFISCEVDQIQEFSFVLDINQFDKKLMIIINKLPYFIILDQIKQSCRSFQLESNPLKFQVIQIDNQSYYILLQLINRLQIYEQNFKLHQSISTQSNIIDFLCLKLENYINKLYILLESKQINIYSLHFSKELTLEITNIGNKQIQIAEPKFLTADNFFKFNNKQSYNILFVYNYDCESINQNTDEMIYILSSFEMNYVSHKSAVNSISMTQNQQYLVSASKDGNIIIWQVFNRFEGYQVFSFSNITETCQSVQIFQDRFIIAKYLTQFMIIDIYKPYSQQTVVISLGEQTKGILIMKDILMLVQGKCAVLYNEKLLKQFQYCVEIFSMAKSFLFTSDNFILIQTDIQIQLYSINYQDKSILLNNTYLSDFPIKFVLMRSFSNSSYVFALTDANNKIVQLNSNFKKQYELQLETIKTVLDLKYPINSDEEIYMFLGIHKDLSLQAKFYIYKIDFSLNPAFEYFYSLQIATEFSIFYIQKDQFGNYFYNFMVLMPVPTYQLYLTFFINKKTKDIQFGLINSSPQKKSSTQITPYINQILNQYIGMESGEIEYSPQYKNQYKSIFQSTSGIITKIHYSLKLQAYYIITQQVSIFNIHTDQFEEKIIFVKTAEEINLITSDELRISLFYQSQEIALKNHNTNQTIQRNDIGLIKGVYIDEQKSVIYIYGSKLAQYNLNLDQKQLINNLNNLQCMFSPDFAFCKVDTQEVQIYSILGNKLLNKINPQGLPDNYLIDIDLNYQYLFCYYQSVQIYKFNGDFVISLNQASKPLIQIKLCGSKVVLFTIGKINLSNLQMQCLQEEDISTGLNILNKLTNQYLLVIQQELDKFLYNLSVLSDTISVSNQFFSQKDQVIGYEYDPQMQCGYFADRLGQFTEINYVAAYSNANFFNLLQLFKTDNLIHYQVNLQTNKIIMGNSLNAYIVDFNLLNRQTQYFYKEKDQKYVQINSNNQNILLFIDKKNFLYKYQDYKIRFLNFFEQSVLDIQLLESFDQIIVALQTQIFVYDVNSFINLSDNLIKPQFMIKGYLYKDYLGEGIFQTYDQKIIQYNFQQNNFQFEYIFEHENDLIISKYWIKNQKILFLGMIQGDILIYSKIGQKPSKIFNSNSIIPIKTFVGISDSNILAFQKNGNIIQITKQENQFITKIIQISYKINYEDISQNESELQNAIFDQVYNRIYCWFVLIQRLFILDTENFNLINYLSFSSNEINRIQIGGNILILYTQFQINFYSRRLLEYLFTIRKSSRFDKILNLTLVQDNFFAISYKKKIEFYIINLNSKIFSLIDQINIDYPIISYYEMIKNSYSKSSFQAHIIGFSLTNIFDKIYNLNLLSSQNNQCSSSLNASSIFTLQSEIEINYQPNSNLTYTFFLKIDSSLETIKAIDQQSSKLVINPLQFNNQHYGIINLNTLSFLIIKKDLILQNFQLNFIDKGVYSTNDEVQKIIFENIYIDSNNIQGVSLKYQNKKQIIFRKLIIKGNYQQRNLQDSDQQQNSLFFIQNVESVSIYDLIIENSSFNKNQNLFFFNNIQQLTIKRVTIKKCQLFQAFDIEQVQKLVLQDFLITDNIISYSQSIFNNQPFVLVINGIQSIIINSLSIMNNQNIFFIKTSNTYVIDNKFITLADDSLIISNIFLNNNLFQILNITSNQHNKVSQLQAMMEFTNQNIEIKHSNIQENQSNIKIYSSSNVTLKNCTFIRNTSQKGGGLFMKLILNQLSIQNSTFVQNTALEDGGGIFMDNVNYTIIYEITKIMENQAYIGGGIRFINTQLSQISISEDSKITNNIAEIYGNNIANYPTKINIKVSYDSYSQQFLDISSQGQQIIDEDDDEGQEQQQIIEINDYKSGGTMNIIVQFVDDDQNILQLSINKIQNNKYPKSISDDMKKLNFQILSNQKLFLSDEGAVNYKQYDQIAQGFIKKDLVVSAQPFSSSDLIFNYQISDQESIKSILLKINFRGCEVGEIEKQISSTNIICQSCPFGFYSLQQFEYIKNQTNNFNEVQCIKCPDSANQCEKNIIQVKNGYWRKNNQTDDIILCENNEEICVPENENNRFGCLEGHIGPLCEQCDLEGYVWDGKKYSQSPKKFSCVECSDVKVQVIFISLTIIGLLIYLLSSFFIFVSSHEKSQICYYFRKMSLLPFSVTQYNNKSNFFMKILVNYLQISSVLQQFQIRYIPQVFSQITNFLGSAVSQITVDTLCVFSKDQVSEYGQGKIKQIIQAVAPFLFTFILLIILLVIKIMDIRNIKKQFIYTLINFLFIFFQTDSLNFFLKCLRCRQIGNENLISQDLLFRCDDQSYQLFIKYFTVPILVFWVVYPIIPLIYLFRNKNKLETCLIKFKFGYFYSEFSQKFYFWEFIRIYLKVFIVFISTFLQEYYIINSLFLNFIIFLYIISVIISNPFFSRKLKELEIYSYVNLSILVIIQSLMKYQNHAALSIIYGFFLYTIVIYMIIVIIIETLNNRSNKIAKIIRQIFYIITRRKHFKNNLNENSSVNSFEALKKWKKIQLNIHLLTKFKAIDIIAQAPKTNQNKIFYENNKPFLFQTQQNKMIIYKKQVNEDAINKYQQTQLSLLSARTKRVDSFDINQRQKDNLLKELKKQISDTSSYNKNNYIIKESFNNQNVSKRDLILDTTVDKLTRDKKESLFYIQSNNTQKKITYVTDQMIDTSFFQNNKNNITQNSAISVTDISDSKQYEDIFTTVDNVKSNNYQTFNEKGQNQTQSEK